MTFRRAVACAGVLILLAEPLLALVIASLNVRNYLGQDRWIYEAYRFAYPKPEEEKARLRQLIRDVRPDLLLLQEMGSDAYLRELQSDLLAEGLAYPFRHFSGRAEGRTGLSLLSKIPPREVIFHAPPVESSEPFLVRGIQELLVAPDEGSAALRIFHVHLKSRYTSDPDDPQSARQRKKEIQLLGDWASRRMAVSGDREDVLLAGDFNTPFEDGLLAPLRETAKSVPLADERGTRWTYHHRKLDKRERVDGFWVPERDAGIAPVGLFPVQGEADAGSDHRMAVVEWRPENSRAGSGEAASPGQRMGMACMEPGSPAD